VTKDQPSAVDDLVPQWQWQGELEGSTYRVVIEGEARKYFICRTDFFQNEYWEPAPERPSRDAVELALFSSRGGK